MRCGDYLGLSGWVSCNDKGSCKREIKIQREADVTTKGKRRKKAIQSHEQGRRTALEADKGKGTDASLAPPKGPSPVDTLTLAQLDGF